MIGIVNYGMGNLGSVENALNYLKLENCIVENSTDFLKCEKIILPGVGAFGRAMENLKRLGFIESLNEHVLIKKKPILGICLGMQLLLSESEEFGKNIGLNYIHGKVESFKSVVKNLPIPHMGWNDVEIKPTSIFYEKEIIHNFYFVHSFYCNVNREDEIKGMCNYGIKFCAMVEKDNVFGCQFHPEKSQKFGMNIYKKFASL